MTMARTLAELAADGEIDPGWAEALAPVQHDITALGERLRGVLVPLIGAERFADLLAGDGDLADALRALPGDLDVEALLDPAGYVGLAPRLARGSARGTVEVPDATEVGAPATGSATGRRDRAASDMNGHGVDE